MGKEGGKKERESCYNGGRVSGCSNQQIAWARKTGWDYSVRMPFIDGRSSVQENCSLSLTRGDDVVDAGDDLPAHQVGRPAQHRPVVHLRARRVRQQAGGALKRKEGEDTSSVTYFGPVFIFYSVVPKNSGMFEFPALLQPTNLGLFLLKLAGTFLHDHVVE